MKLSDHFNRSAFDPSLTFGRSGTVQGPIKPFHTDNQIEQAALDPLYQREDLFHTNQRILSLDDRNKYYVTRGDFQSPTMYQLNILRTNARVKVRAFLPKHNRKNLSFVGQVPQTYPFVPCNYENEHSNITNPQAMEKF